MATNLAAPSGFTVNDLVFNDNFSGTSLNASSWNNYITDNAAQGTPWFSYQGGSGVGGQYEDEFDMPSQVLVNNGLSLDAVRKPIYAPNEINGAMIMQTYPVTSGVVSTYGKMELNGGYVQISMKEPGGNGSWPGLWLLPGSGAGNVGDNFEIDIQEGGVTAGGANPNTTFSYHLHTPSGTFGGEVDTGVDLTAAYHTYAINWVPGQSITWFLDGHQVATITSAQAPIPNEPMELIMSNQVANSNAAGWHTTFDSSTPQSMNMQVGDVQIYQAPGSGDTITGGSVAPPVVSSGTPPTLAINAIDGNDVINKAEAATGVPISGTASNATGGAEIVGQIVTVSLNGKTYSGAVQSNGTWSVTVAASDAQTLSDGSHTVTADVTDKAGNPASQATHAVMVDETAPTLAINPVDGNNLVTSANAAAGVLISGTASDADGSADVAGQTVTVGLNGKTYSGAVQSDGTWSVTVAASDAQALTNGGYTVTADVTDTAGNPAAEAHQAVTVNQSVVAAPPTLNVASSSLDVPAGGSVPLGVSLGAVNSDDVLSVSISGVPRYEWITAAGATASVSQHGHTYTFSALPASDWNNGLVIHSRYGGSGQPTAVLTITASSTTAGETLTAPAKTITVTDPPASNVTVGSAAVDQFNFSSALNRQVENHVDKIVSSEPHLAASGVAEHPPQAAAADVNFGWHAQPHLLPTATHHVASHPDLLVAA